MDVYYFTEMPYAEFPDSAPEGYLLGNLIPTTENPVRLTEEVAMLDVIFPAFPTRILCARLELLGREVIPALREP